MKTDITMEQARQWRTTRSRWSAGGVCAALVACTAVLWLLYKPGEGPGGFELRMACCLAAAILCAVTAAHPLAGLALMAFSVPLLNGVPLHFTDGNPYVIVMFTAAGFVAGWLVREAVQPSGWRPFRSQAWLWLFVLVAATSTAASFLRYYPVWMWDVPAFKMQAVNVTGLARADAARHVVFSLANVVTFALVISAAHGVMRRYAHVPHAGRLVLAALVLGAACTAGIAVYQARCNINFCTNKSYYWKRLTRVNGFCSDPNALGTYIGLSVTMCGLAIVFAGSLASWRSWMQRVMALGVAAVLVFALKYSGSRSGLLAVLLACVFSATMGLAYYADRLLQRIRILALVRVAVAAAVVAACLAATLVVSVKATRYFDGKVSVNQSSSSLVRRLYRDLRFWHQQDGMADAVSHDRRMQFWRYAAQFIGMAPLSGIGLGAYVVELPNECTMQNERLFRTDNACNYYLHYCAETGVIGLVCLVGFYGILLFSLALRVRHWGMVSTGQLQYKLLLGCTVVVFMVVLVFGVHTLADEVNVAFAVLLGLAAAEAGDAPRHVPLRLRTVMAALVVAAVGIHAWRTWVDNHGQLNGERRLAAAGVPSEIAWFDWETWAGQPFRVRWMGREAVAVMPRANIELAVPIMSGSAASSEKPQRVSFFLNGECVRTHVFTQPGEWALIRLAVPYATPFKQAVAPHTTLRIEATPTWIPRVATGADDDRTLGVLVGEFRWREPEEADGGWHARERLDDGTPYNWSSSYAWRKVPVLGTNSITIPIYASNILLRRRPLDVAIYLNRQLLDVVSLREKRWERRKYALPAAVPPNTTAVVEFATSRTWVPRHYGFDDSRPLGVAVGAIRCE